MNIFSLPDIIGLFFNLSLAAGIIDKSDTKKHSGVWLIAIIILFSIWIFVDLLSLNFADKQTALLAAQITYRIIFLLPAFILAMSIRYQTGGYIKKQSPWIFFIIFAFPILILSLSFPNFNLELITFNSPSKIRYFALSLDPTPAFWSILVLSVIYIIISIKLFLKLQRQNISIYEKKYLRRLTFGLSFLFFAFLTIHIISSYLKSYSYLNFLKTSFLFIEIFTFYIISREFNNSDKKTTTKFYDYVLFAVILVFYFFLIKYTVDIIDNYFKIHKWYFDALQVLTYTLIFHPVAVNIQKFIQSKKNKQLLKYRKNFLKLSRELIEIIPFREFSDKISSFITDNFNCKNVLIFNFNENKNEFELSYKNKKYTITPQSEFIKSIDKKNINDFFNLPYKRLQSELINILIENDIQLILPLSSEKGLMMFIALSKKANNKDYLQSEIENLSIFSGEISLYLRRNLALEKLQKREKEKFRLEKLAALGQLTAGIAHEIRNPLNTISSASQTLTNKQLNKEQQQRMLKYINEETDRISELMNDFLQLSKLKSPEYEVFELSELLNKIKVYVSERNDKIELKINNSIKEKIKSDKKYLYQILTNIISNAVDAIEKRCEDDDLICSEGIVKISLQTKNNNYIFDIEDNGVGIPEEYSETIFNPFFTLKETGTGLGLALVVNMVKALNGSITLLNVKNNTHFRITIPKVK